jgi:hypothetical protein
MFRQFLVVWAVILVAVPGVAWGLEEIATLTPEEAAKAGMIVRAQASGPEAVGVQLELPTKGELQHFARVELSIRDGKKTVLFTTLKEERSPEGHVTVGFVLARSLLPQCTLRVVTQDGLSRIAREMAMKDFVDLGKLR